jgi:hypothetical protein
VVFANAGVAERRTRWLRRQRQSFVLCYSTG